ncbi:ORF-57 [Agrotis segetum nucleopolyhedrovirus A]|uniref:ORF-57 n=1 Tax=Agrotis segetum nuclear polyhedrosis virus TaxID=1962501 RepID=Q287L5_NPVAS|nr:ORF-57 [Agrotis segetum nucleopolyhedrovirus A]AAZ38223.1 ORF-57 [Agrotis segetum nucleopolyhedrovirus A]
MFARTAIRRACNSIDSKYRDVLVRFVDNINGGDVRSLLERLLLAFDVNVVYNVLEQIKAIVWAVVKTAYARNKNLLSFNRHLPHVQFAESQVMNAADPELLIEFTRSLYRQHCVYELVEDSVTWDELVELLCSLDNIIDNKSVINKIGYNSISNSNNIISDCKDLIIK